MAELALRYLEDYPVGLVLEYGDVLVDADEIRAFAAQYDPQPFHLGDGGGDASPFGGLAASGWHTAGMVMRMLVDQGFICGETSLGSPGMDRLRWTRPVKPGDRLRARIELTENRPSRSKTDRGSITFDLQVFNQRDDVVMTVSWIAIVRRRPSGGGP